MVLRGAPGSPEATGATHFAPGFEYDFGTTHLSDSKDAEGVSWYVLVSIDPRTGDVYLECDGGGLHDYCADKTAPYYLRVREYEPGPPGACRDWLRHTGPSCSTRLQVWLQQSGILADRVTENFRIVPRQASPSTSGSRASRPASYDFDLLDAKDAVLGQVSVDVLKGAINLDGKPVPLSNDDLVQIASACGDPRWER